MITLEEYLRDPCGSLSIPYWKWKTISIPDSMKIVHDREYGSLGGYADEPYFRLYHTLENIASVHLEQFTVRTAKTEDISQITEIINRSYSDIIVTREQLYCLTTTKVYDENLWIIAVECATGKPAGCAIADLDTEAGEGILEWIQVLPEYRRKGVGRLLVTQLLQRMRGQAAFATVSGRCENTTKPELLYRACGFRGNDIWHILHKK